MVAEKEGTEEEVINTIILLKQCPACGGTLLLETFPRRQHVICNGCHRVLAFWPAEAIHNTQDMEQIQKWTGLNVLGVPSHWVT